MASRLSARPKVLCVCRCAFERKSVVVAFAYSGLLSIACIHHQNYLYVHRYLKFMLRRGKVLLYSTGLNALLWYCTRVLYTGYWLLFPSACLLWRVGITLKNCILPLFFLDPRNDPCSNSINMVFASLIRLNVARCTLRTRSPFSALRIVPCSLFLVVHSFTSMKLC